MSAYTIQIIKKLNKKNNTYLQKKSPVNKTWTEKKRSLLQVNKKKITGMRFHKWHKTQTISS